MIDPRETELRQIKRILLAILVCVIIIVLALAPVLIPVVLVIGSVYIFAVFGVAMAQTARFTIRQLWYAIASHWRR
jgi:hypothetical protein